jgi:lauroyl/myristoyl acyltransferase
MLLIGKKDAVTRRISLVLNHTVDPKNLQDQWIRYKRHVGKMLLEWNKMERMTSEELQEFVTLEGEAHLHHSLGLGGGAVLLFNHFGNVACVAAMFGRRGYDINVIVNPLPLPSLERRYQRKFGYYGAKRILVGSGTFYEAGRVLARNGLLASAIDYSIRGRNTIWTSFHNAEISVSPGPVILALRHGAPILFTTCRPRSGEGYVFTIHPQIHVDPSFDHKTNAARIVHQGIELLLEDIKRSPAEWWSWDHAQIRKRQDTVMAMSAEAGQPLAPY